MEEIPEREVTDWNSSLEGLRRLNNYLDLCNELSIRSKTNGNNYEMLKRWKLAILNVRKEIIPKMEEKQKKQITKTLKKYSKIGGIIENKKTPKGRKIKINTENFNKYWKLNDELETKLRIIADNKGMLIINKVIDDLHKAILQNR